MQRCPPVSVLAVNMPFTKFLSGFVEYNHYDFATRDICFRPRLVGLRPGFLEPHPKALQARRRSPLIASIAADVGASVPRVRRAMRSMGFLGGRPRTGAPVKYAQDALVLNRNSAISPQRPAMLDKFGLPSLLPRHVADWR